MMKTSACIIAYDSYRTLQLLTKDAQRILGKLVEYNWFSFTRQCILSNLCFVFTLTCTCTCTCFKSARCVCVCVFVYSVCVHVCVAGCPCTCFKSTRCVCVCVLCMQGVYMCVVGCLHVNG